MIKMTEKQNLLKTLRVCYITHYTNTKQNLIIQLTQNQNYQPWEDKLADKEENPEKEISHKKKLRDLSNDILLYTFGLRKAKPENPNKREYKLARKFWNSQNKPIPNTEIKALDTPQLKNYLMYDKHKRVIYEIYYNKSETFLPQEINIRIQLAKHLTKNWKNLVETRINELFSGNVKHTSKVTKLYDLKEIFIINEKK